MSKYRHELKFEINTSDFFTLRQRLKTVLHSDIHSGSDGKYHVRSLYFDSDNDSALRAKLDGLPSREKYRIRLYNSDSSSIRLEKKSKINGLTSKLSTIISLAECEKILSGNVQWITETDNAVLLEFYAKSKSGQLKPKTLVDYQREAYIYPFGNVRVTIDNDVRSGLYATNLFDIDTPMLPVSQSGTMLMEVKYDEFLPGIVKDIIAAKNRHAAPFSKYAQSRIYG